MIRFIAIFFVSIAIFAASAITVPILKCYTCRNGICEKGEEPVKTACIEDATHCYSATYHFNKSSVVREFGCVYNVAAEYYKECEQASSNKNKDFRCVLCQEDFCNASIRAVNCKSIIIMLAVLLIIFL